MEIIFRISLFVAGIINFIPSLIAFFPERVNSAYGIHIPDANFELLLRHRAILFGIIGGLMLFSAISKKYYELATLMGLVSMISFLILFSIHSSQVNEALTKVMKIDGFAILFLFIGFILYKFKDSIF